MRGVQEFTKKEPIWKEVSIMASSLDSRVDLAAVKSHTVCSNTCNAHTDNITYSSLSGSQLDLFCLNICSRVFPAVTFMFSPTVITDMVVFVLSCSVCGTFQLVTPNICWKTYECIQVKTRCFKYSWYYHGRIFAGSHSDSQVTTDWQTRETHRQRQQLTFIVYSESYFLPPFRMPVNVSQGATEG